MKHLNCFSLNSPFGYLIKNKGKNLFIDIPPRPANETKLVGFVFHHVIEQAAKASYRYLKEFKGYYVNRQKFKKLVKIKLFVTKFNYKVYIRKNIDSELKRKKLLKKTLEIDPNNSAAALLNNLAKKMITEGWAIYDQYGFLAKEISGTGININPYR